MKDPCSIFRTLEVPYGRVLDYELATSVLKHGNLSQLSKSDVLSAALLADIFYEIDAGTVFEFFQLLGIGHQRIREIYEDAVLISGNRNQEIEGILLGLGV